MREVILLKEINDSWPKGVKRTKLREKMLLILKASEKPLSARDICDEMQNSENNIWLSTIYRSLQLFIEKDIVIKTNIANNTMAVYELNCFKHRHYAVCMNCHKIVNIEHCPIEQFVPKIEDDHFQITGHNFEVFGFCKDCNRK